MGDPILHIKNNRGILSYIHNVQASEKMMRSQKEFFLKGPSLSLRNPLVTRLGSIRVNPKLVSLNTCISILHVLHA